MSPCKKVCSSGGCCDASTRHHYFCDSSLQLVAVETVGTQLSGCNRPAAQLRWLMPIVGVPSGSHSCPEHRPRGLGSYVRSGPAHFRPVWNPSGIACVWYSGSKTRKPALWTWDAMAQPRPGFSLHPASAGARSVKLGHVFGAHRSLALVFLVVFVRFRPSGIVLQSTFSWLVH